MRPSKDISQWSFDEYVQDIIHEMLFNSLVLGRCNSDFKSIIFKLILQNSTLGIEGKIALSISPSNS